MLALFYTCWFWFCVTYTGQMSTFGITNNNLLWCVYALHTVWCVCTAHAHDLLHIRGAIIWFFKFIKKPFSSLFRIEACEHIDSFFIKMHLNTAHLRWVLFYSFPPRSRSYGFIEKVLWKESKWMSFTSCTVDEQFNNFCFGKWQNRMCAACQGLYAYTHTWMCCISHSLCVRPIIYVQCM